MMPHWSNAFVGLAWQPGIVDCWRLVRLVYASRGVDLPAYDEVGPAEKAEIAALIGEQSKTWPWQPIAAGRERPYDVLVFRSPRQDHIGVVIDRGRMLHISEGKQSCVERYESGLWKPRLAGIYRHAALA